MRVLVEYTQPLHLEFLSSQMHAMVQHTHLKPFAMKPWPFYRKMQNFMPVTQPRGTYSFDPSSSSAQSVLDKVNAEEDGVGDQDGPLLDLSHANIAGAFFSSNLDILGLGALPSEPSLSHFSSSGGTRPPSLSSLSPMAHPGHPYSTQPCDLSMAWAWHFLTPIAILATPNIKNENTMGNRQGAHALPAPNVRLRASERCEPSHHVDHSQLNYQPYG